MQKSKLLGVFGGIFLFVSFGMLVFLMAASSQQELIYSTYVEGQGCDIAVDGAGFAYVARFAGTKTKVDGNPGGISTLVSKIDVTGDGQAEWHTWIGGSARESNERPGEIARDSDGNILIAGRTTSPDFPTTDGTTLAGDDSHYLVMLSKDDGHVMYSTMFESYSGYFKVGVGVGGGYVYVAGSSGDKVLLTKFRPPEDPGNENPLELDWSILFGGSGWDYGQSVAVDSSGNAYVTGQLGSSDMLDQNNNPVIIKGQTDVFVAKFNIAGDLLNITTLGGNEPTQQGNEELGFGIAVHEGSGRVYVTGRVTSPNFTTTSNAVNPTYNGGRDAFFAVLDSTLANLIYSTYLGGSDLDRGQSVAVDDAGYAYVSAWAGSNDIETTLDAYKPTSNGNDAFLWVIDPGETGIDSLFSATYLGGTKGDRGRGIRVHTDGSVYMTGLTGSRNFPVSSNAYLDTPQSGFVSVLAWPEPNDPPVVTIAEPADGATVLSGATIVFEGSASDNEDGDLTTGLAWNSSINGLIGSGGSFSIFLSDGVHTITASVTDSGGKTGSASITITVGTPPEPDPIGVASIDYSLTGRGNRDLQITCILDKLVEGAIISIELYRNGTLDRSFSGPTDSLGVVSFRRNKPKNGTYASFVIDVNADGYEWDGETPSNSYTK